MPSDARVTGALRALAAPLAHYRSAVATTLDEVHGALAAHRSGRDGGSTQLRAELGRFADGRVDAARLAGILGEEATLDPEGERALHRALEALRAVSARGEALFLVEVAAGGDVAAAVAARLAEAGRAFAAARVATHVLARYTAPESSLDQALDGFPFPQWSAAERRVAPPLVVAVAGSDLRVGGLADILDGALKVVLVVSGECAPAPLARLITSQTLVVQTEVLDGLSTLATSTGPAVAALVPASAARFVHHPAAAAEPRGRLTVHHLPDAPSRAVGGLSPAQQAEDLRRLAALASPPAASAAGGGAPAVPGEDADPIDRLAAWLLRQADLPRP